MQVRFCALCTSCTVSRTQATSSAANMEQRGVRRISAGTTPDRYKARRALHAGVPRCSFRVSPPLRNQRGLRSKTRSTDGPHRSRDPGTCAVRSARPLGIEASKRLLGALAGVGVDTEGAEGERNDLAAAEVGRSCGRAGIAERHSCGHEPEQLKTRPHKEHSPWHDWI